MKNMFGIERNSFKGVFAFVINRALSGLNIIPHIIHRAMPDADEEALSGLAKINKESSGNPRC